MSIVLIFILSTTSFTVAFVINWSRPEWFEILSSVLFILDAISNSMVFLIQKNRGQRTIINARNGSEDSEKLADKTKLLKN